jgi:hypothetical protein
VPGATNNFQLSADGESVYLFSGDAQTNLTGYSHGFSFGAAADDVSFGRYVISTGEEQFPAQLSRTFDGPNSGTRVGPVVITEIMFHPPPGGDEFVELKNISGAAVELFDPGHPTNTWQFGGLNYAFAPGLTLETNAFLLIVPVDPATFRAKYGVPSGLQIVGPYSGQLQNSGERLELKRPGRPTTNGVPYITVDEVRYNDKAPWPALADGFGPSLQRINSAVYGNDPANWLAAAPSLGADFAGGVAPKITVQPSSQSVVRYQNALLSVGASGSAPLHYQWQFEGANLSNATTATLTITNLQLTQAGGYHVTVFNSAGVATSAVAVLTVLTPPTITAQPQSKVVAVGSNVTFNVTANGNGSLMFQWRFNTTNIPGATASSLMLANLQEEQSGEYSVMVTDSVGFIISQPATLLVAVKPAVTAQPQGVIAVTGDTVTFRVSASGSLPLGYRWRRNGATLTNFVLYSHTSTFTLTNVQLSNAANYAVVITNVIPPGVATSNATLVVLADSDGDHVPDIWETQFGFNPNDPSDALADSDHDGMSNLAEYIAGTDPTDPKSYLKVDSIAVSNTVSISFLAISNKTYTVEYRDNVTAGPWSRLADVASRTTNHVETIVGPRSGTNSYYRLVTPMQP